MTDNDWTIYKFLNEKFPKLQPVWHGLEEVIKRTEYHHIYLMSAGIAFNILLCIIPLILVAIFVIGLMYDTEHLVLMVSRSLSEILPASQTTSQFIFTTMEEIHKIAINSSTAGLVGLGILLWTSSALFSSLRAGLNAIFHIPSPRFFLFYKLKDIFLTGILAILVLLAAFMAPLLSFFRNFWERVLPDNIVWLFSNVTIGLFSVLTSFLLFFFLFRFVPDRTLNKRLTVGSTLLCVFLWELARFLFGMYLDKVSNLGRFYGTYAVLVSFAIWIYYSSLIILLSAEVVKYVDERQEEHERRNLSPEVQVATPD